jgi:hypothetical protein
MNRGESDGPRGMGVGNGLRERESEGWKEISVVLILYIGIDTDID